MLRSTVTLAALLAALPAGALLTPLPPVPSPPTQPPRDSTPATPAAQATGKPAAAGAAQAIPRGAVLEEVSGVLQGFDRQAHRLTVGTPGGPVTLSVDRNTMVYTSAGLGTVADLVPGTQLRAGRNADWLAYWVQVKRPAGDAEPPSTPGQGTGPGGGAGPPAEGTTGTGAPPSNVGPGSVGPGAAPGASAPGR